MATLNVLLTATAKDKGVKKFFVGATKAADKFTASVEDAVRAGRQLAGLNVPATGGGRGGGGGGGAASRPRAASGRGKDPIDAALRQIAKDRARTSKRQNKQAASVVDQQIAAGRAETRILQQQARERQRQSRLIKNLSKEQLEAVELEREINNRRSRAARSQAKQKLGPDATPRAGGTQRRFESAENLSVAAGEFQKTADTIDRGVRASNQSFRDFGKGIAEIETLEADITQEEISKAVKEAALAFGTLPTEQTKAFYAVVSAGATDAESATAQLTAANRLAVGGVASTEEAVLAISKGLANFSDQGATATSVADSLFGAVQLGQVTVSEMAIALPKVAQTAGAAGLSLSETNAALAVLSKQSGSAKLGATNLDEALRQLIAPTEKADEVVDKLNKRLKKAGKGGVELGAAGLKAAGGFEGFLKKLKEAGATDKDLKQIFGGSGFKAVRGLTVSLADVEKGFAATEKAIADSDGLSLKASNKLMQTASKRAEVLDAKFELLKIQAGEGLLPVMEGVAAAVGPVIEGLTELIHDNPTAAKTVGALALGVLGLTRVVGGVASAMSMWNTIAGLTATKTTAVTAATNKGAVSATKYGKAAGGASKLLGAMPAIAIGATVAIAGFNLVLDQAQKPLAKFEDRLEGIAAKQQKIAFGPTSEDIDNVNTLQTKLAALDAMDEPRGSRKKKQRAEERKAIEEQLAAARTKVKASEKSEKTLLLERRGRLVETVNAAREARRVGGGGAAADELRSGNVAGAFGQAAGGVLSKVTGVSDTLQSTQDQTELDLAKFDRDFGAQAGIDEAQRFKTDVTSASEGGFAERQLAAFEALNATMMTVAANTDVSQGPSMEAGLNA